MDAQRIKRRSAQLNALRQPHEQAWSDAFGLTFPERGSNLLTTVLSAQDVQRLKTEIYDDTAGDACRVGAASLMGGLVPASAQWFGLDVGTESQEELAWLDSFAEMIWENIHAANFDAEAFDGMLDLWAAGWFVLYVDEQPGGGYSFELWPLAQCRIGSTRSAQLIDTLYRTYEYTVAQCVGEFGIDAVSDKVREAYHSDKLDETVELLHAIEPRPVHAVDAKLAKNLPFSSVHMEVQAQHILRESGYHEFPCMVPRWSRVPASPYAVGPMSAALATTRTLNEVARLNLIGAETAIAPPMVAEDDGVLNPRAIKMGPRKIIIANSVDSIKPLITGAKVEFGELKAERLQGMIRKILLADQMPPADGPVKTAYEWSVRVETLRKMLGPMFGRFQSEFLQPLVERTFGILWRANQASGWQIAGEPPASLLGRNFVVKYQSPMARSQRLEDVAAMDRYELALGQEAQIFGPQVLDVYDIEAAGRERAQLLGVPARLIRDDRQLLAKRKADGEAQQAAQQQQMAQQGQLEAQSAMAQRMAAA